jgi:acyl-CoA dehydrogenase
MDFSLTEEQLELKDLTHQFAKNEMRPVAGEYDEKNEFPVEVMKKAFEIGFLTSGIPVEYGGTGFSNVDNAVVCEELGWGCAGMFTSMMANTLALTPIVLYGSDEQKKEFLEPYTKEMSFACFGLTERDRTTR